MSYRVLLTTLCIASVATIAAGAEPSQGLSPGLPNRVVMIDVPCPTFSWSQVPKARGYELAVTELEEDSLQEQPPSGTPVTQVLLPAGSGSWTPSEDKCLDPGQSYAWSVRALTATRPGAWSAGLAFRVSGSASGTTLEALLGRIEELESKLDLAERKTRAVASLPLSNLAGAVGFPSAVQQQVAESELIGSAAIEAENAATTGEVYGILGISNSADKNAAGVAGENTVTSGRTVGILGVAYSNEGVGVRGMNLATTSSGTPEWAVGVQGSTASPQGIGVTGISESTTGENAGVVGVVSSGAGFGGLFLNEAGGSLLGATSNPSDLSTLDFEVESGGTVHLTGFLALTPFDASVNCTDENRGWIYFDASLGELCVCEGAPGPWVQADGGGNCP